MTEKKVDKLVEWNEKGEGEVSAASRVHFYKTYESEYEGFGQYWLARAVAHYDNYEYEDCLKSIQRYADLQIGIYRQDYELAKVLPIAIAAASQIYVSASDNHGYKAMNSSHIMVVRSKCCASRKRGYHESNNDCRRKAAATPGLGA